MTLRIAMRGWVLVAFLILAVTAKGQPADCGEGPIPDQPLVLRTPGSPDAPLPAVKVGFTAMRTTLGDDPVVYKELDLVMEDGTRKTMFDGVMEADVRFLVAEGQSIDGRVFHRSATKLGAVEFDGQAKQAALLGWEVKIPGPVSARAGNLYAIDATYAAYVASMRLEFGKQQGTTLPGKIRLCIPGNQKGLFDAVLKDPIEIVGSFTAVVK